MHRRRFLATLSLAATLFAAPANAEDAIAEPNARLDPLSSGTHLFGPKFDAKSLRGKIVLVTIGGG